VSLTEVAVGVAPRLQVSTLPALDAVGALNLKGKWNVLREQGVDLAIEGRGARIPVGALLDRARVDVGAADLGGRLADFGVRSSIHLWRGLSLHQGIHYATVGVQDRGQAVAIPIGTWAPEVASALGLEGDLAPHLRAEVVSLRLAAVAQLNRRDAIVLQGRLWPYGKARVGVKIPAPYEQPSGLEGLGQDVEISMATGGLLDPRLTGTWSVAWQLTWRRVEARIGVGTSAVPWTWALGTLDLAWRLGGPRRP